MHDAIRYDAKAILVARAVNEIATPDDIFLFGSRARGDWDDTSDIDIFTIADADPATKERHRHALKAGQARALELYGRPVKIDLVRYSLADFERFPYRPHSPDLPRPERRDLHELRTGRP